MHSLANLCSKDLSTSSKTSRNVVPSFPLGRMGRMESSPGKSSKHSYNLLAPPSYKKLENPPEDLSHDFDSDDSEDCESIGSNSPNLEGANRMHTNQRDVTIDEHSGKPSIHGSNKSMRENPSNIHIGAKDATNIILTKNGATRNHGPKSMVPNPKNTSNNVIVPKPTRSMSNNTPIVISNKHIEIGGEENGSQCHTNNIFNKISKKDNTKYPSTRNNARGSLAKEKTTAQKCNEEIILKLDDPIHFDEGDGGGHPHATTNQPDVNKHTSCTTSHLTENKNYEYQECFDEGDGGGFDSRSHVNSRRHKRHGRHARYGRKSSKGSEQSYQGSSRGREQSHRGSSRGSERSHIGLRRGSGGSSKRSRVGSQESGKHSRRGRTGRQRNSRGTSNQSSRRSSKSRSQPSNASWMDEYQESIVSGYKPYPAKWRCFGRRPPAIHEFRPMGEGRVKNVRPAGKPAYLVRNADEKRGCRGPDASDAWDVCYGVAKPITDQWCTPLPYGTQVIRAGDIDPCFCPSRGDIVIINPTQNFYQAMKSGYVKTYCGRGYSFGVGDLIVHLGRFMPNGEYIPYGNLELYMHTSTREMRLLGRQPFLLVDFNYHNLDYESPGKHLPVGTFLNESFFPRRGDIIIRGGAWAENYPNFQRKHHSSVKYWRPRMEFLPNDMLLRPYVDIGGKTNRSGRNFYWGAAELYTYSGKGLAWAYWGRDHHICDTPYPREQEHGIKTGHHKDEVGHYADGARRSYGDGYRHGHRATDGCHSEHDLSSRHRRQPHRSKSQRRQRPSHSHHADDDCHREHELSRHPN